jgi:hypothetical protein
MRISLGLVYRDFLEKGAFFFFFCTEREKGPTHTSKDKQTEPRGFYKFNRKSSGSSEVGSLADVLAGS